MNKKIINLFSITLIMISLISCSRSMSVRTDELDKIKEEILINEQVEDIYFEFVRPQMDINIIVNQDFNLKDLETTVAQLSETINKKNMDEVARKYWTKDSIITNVYVNFYSEKIDENNLLDNLIYKTYTKYYKTNSANNEISNIDNYKTWFIELNEKDILLKEYLNKEL